MRSSGKFITIEGVEGSGKTTQRALLADYLREQGIDVVVTREPGGTRVGERIREILLSPEYSTLTYQSEVGILGEQMPLFRIPPHSTLTPLTELLLFLAARAQQVAEIMIPALKSGKWVICDRFSDATFAYQGYGRSIDLASIQKLNEIATQRLKPDITVLLDLDVDIGIRRALSAKKEFAGCSNGDRMEQQYKKFHRSVREGYLQLARKEPNRIKVVPVSGSIEEIHNTVVSLVAPFLVKTP
jgi:dTMP kinase